MLSITVIMWHKVVEYTLYYFSVSANVLTLSVVKIKDFMLVVVEYSFLSIINISTLVHHYSTVDINTTVMIK